MGKITITGGVVIPAGSGSLTAKPTPPPPIPLTLVGASLVEENTGSIAFPVGTQAGDLAILSMIKGAAPIPTVSGGWTVETSGIGGVAGSGYAIYTKTLIQADIDTPPTFDTTSGGYDIIVYRDHNAITLKGFTIDNTTTSTIAGFTKAVGSKRILALWIDRDDVLGSIDPVGFTEINQDFFQFFNVGASDILSADYTNGTDIIWTGELGNEQLLAVLEIT